ncbi:class II lanthipeptide, LchA2/BrtA2 family [Cellulomonas taurus]|jgi:hypothetical protein|uniref:class II lanthipeptide, LchA2/BrtA2 family n=1 Tax=Cellulomonas taurus TaxID=2729175 RepID=UPI00145F1EFE|nr:class II lanthipeptide, LchA2/BrtA2 family [Cellulomonas taurus]
MNANDEGLELGRYTDDELLEIADGDTAGAGTPTVVLSIVSAWISNNTCPSSACTRAC